ncbi:hypothetical protein LN42_01045 [Marinitoga sp. 1137]|uniref:restriction endonuclease subunit S n=1 Tax=Marinitoga sp. 1137 TaxID=1545835 RepID=UPI00095079E3|nr:restriction endonuclease subunit S [Marinitoga sp. 1137]APT75137.1 hypothetical protein LN42_01045 [Marinitoga sp. 1137]
MKKIKLKEISNIFLSPQVEETPEGNFNYIKLSSITKNKIEIEKLSKAVYNKNRNIEKYLLKKNDIIFSAKGSNIFAVHIDKEIPNLISAQFFFNIRINSGKILPEFLTIILNNEYAKRYFEERRVGKIIKVIKKKTLEDFELTLPPLEIQKQIIEIVKNFEKEKKLKLKSLQLKEELIDKTIFLKVWSDLCV